MSDTSKNSQETVRMKRFLTSSVSSIIFETGRLTRNGRPKGLRILTYHRVNDIPGDRLSVHPQEFEKQMSWLKEHGYAGVSVKEGLGRLRAHDEPIPIAITFDDGYLDNFTSAFPILKKYLFYGTIYTITSYISNSRDRTYLNWDEIREMKEYGIEIGSHTVTHPRLTSVDSVKVKEEVQQSKKEIEQKLEIPCESFCYPGGLLNSEIANQVREAGYSNATTVSPGANHSGQDPFLLKRTEISGEDSLFEFEKKISGAYDILHKTWQMMGGLK